MKNILMDNGNNFMIDHIVDNIIKPTFKNCDVHVSDMCGDIHFDIGLIGNVLHKNGHLSTPDPLKLTMILSIIKDENGIKLYNVRVDTWSYYVKSGRIDGLCCNLSLSEYTTMLKSFSNYMKVISIVMWQYRNDLQMRDDIRHLYI